MMKSNYVFESRHVTRGDENYVDSSQVVSPALIEEFKSWISLSTSKDTTDTYASTLKKYCLGMPIEMINRKDFFVELSEGIKRRGLALGTVMRHTAATKKFLHFMNEKYDLPIINLDVIKCRRPPKHNPTYLEMYEIEAIRQIPTRSIIQLRDRALFEFLLYSGCRIGEALNIDWRQIDFEKGRVEVLGKGNRKRIVALGDSKPWIQEYLANRKSDLPPLFLSQYKLHALNRGNAATAIRELGVAARLKKRIHPHLLRHTFGSYSIWAGVDARTLQEVMGHEDLETTLKYYSAVTQERMDEANLKLNSFIAGTQQPSRPKENAIYPLYR